MKHVSACLLLLIVGCGVRPPIEGRLDPHVPPQVNFTEKWLRNATAVGTPIPSRDRDTQILHVQVPIRNMTSGQLFIDYRVKFVDGNGQLIGLATAWRDKVLDPNVPDMISFNSTTPLAADFQLDIRPAK